MLLPQVQSIARNSKSVKIFANPLKSVQIDATLCKSMNIHENLYKSMEILCKSMKNSGRAVRTSISEIRPPARQDQG